jgi:tRNA nucleotidyltransferase (CCA-adding enzyme)
MNVDIHVMVQFQRTIYMDKLEQDVLDIINEVIDGKYTINYKPKNKLLFCK